MLNNFYWFFFYFVSSSFSIRMILWEMKNLGFSNDNSVAYVVTE